jgi:protein SDA1
MYTMMSDPNEMAAKQSLKVMVELYRKHIWYFPLPSPSLSPSLPFLLNCFLFYYSSILLLLLLLFIYFFLKRNDAKTVNVISTGVFSKNTNIVVSTLKFFLTVAADDEEDKIAEQKEKVFNFYILYFFYSRFF